MANDSSIILIDGQQEFSGGVDSSKVTTMASELVPNGMARNELCWLINAAIRDGGITCRFGWAQRNALVSDGSLLVQGAAIYDPLSGLPYMVVLIGGILYKILLTDPYTVTDLTGGNVTLRMPPAVEQAFFLQAEEFLIIQAGDFSTLPLFWDGATLRRSKGIISSGVAPGTPGINELPAAGPMEYYEYRVWYAQGNTLGAGDIVGGNSGTAPYRRRDSILNVTENPLVVGGDNFSLPSGSGNIRAMKASSTLDAALGQKNLFIFTRKQVFSLDVPITRSEWIAASSTNMPKMTVVQFVNGSVNDRSVVGINGDFFFQSLEPAIRSLITAIRYYHQWGNTPVSANEDRILRFNDRALMHMASGMEFENRLWQTALPKQTAAGVAHQAIIPLDFDPISSFKKQPEKQPAWEGHYEGADVLQMLSTDYGGLQRAFGLVVSRQDSSVQLYEFTPGDRMDSILTDDRRITWMVETPAYNFNLPQKLKQLKGGEIWLDRVFGTVTVQVWYRPDASPCWVLWHRHEFCVSRSTCENVIDPICYPETGQAEGYKWPIVLPKPPATCDPMGVRPTDIGFQHQMRIAVTGWARIRSIFVYGVQLPHSIYQGLTQQNSPAPNQAIGS